MEQKASQTNEGRQITFTNKNNVSTNNKKINPENVAGQAKICPDGQYELPVLH